MTRYAAWRGAAVHGVDEGHWEALLLMLTEYVDTSFLLISTLFLVPLAARLRLSYR